MHNNFACYQVLFYYRQHVFQAISLPRPFYAICNFSLVQDWVTTINNQFWFKPGERKSQNRWWYSQRRYKHDSHFIKRKTNERGSSRAMASTMASVPLMGPAGGTWALCRLAKCILIDRFSRHIPYNFSLTPQKQDVRTVSIEGRPNIVLQWNVYP